MRTVILMLADDFGKALTRDEEMFTDRRIPTRWWHEPQYLNLSANAQRVLFCLWLSRETWLCGVTILDAWTVADRLRMTRKAVKSRLAELEAAGFVSLDAESLLIWLHEYVEVQQGNRRNANVKWRLATGCELKSLNVFPDTAMIRRFLAHYCRPAEGSK